MKYLQYLLITGCTIVVMACAPDDDLTLGTVMSPEQLSYTVTQTDDPNRIVLSSETPGIIPFWDYEIGISNSYYDTVDIPFKGDFWVKYRALQQGGSVVDSTMITITQFDPDFFSNPMWQLLTNGEEGKTWKLIAVKGGDAKSKTFNDWGDAGWISQNVQFGDSVTFDIDKGFNFTRYTSGVPSEGSFGFEFNEVLPGYLVDEDPGTALILKEGGLMPARDPSNEMAPDNKDRFRVYKLSADTLVLGQGAYYTESRQLEGWTFFHWYLRQ